MNKYAVRQVSETLSIPKETLRYYDKIGLVSPLCGENHYRYYTDENLHDLMYIQVMKLADFSLSEISRVLQNKNDPTMAPESLQDTLSLLHAKEAETQQKIHDLTDIVQLIQTSIHALEGSHCKPEIDQLVQDIYGSLSKRK